MSSRVCKRGHAVEGRDRAKDGSCLVCNRMNVRLKRGSSVPPDAPPLNMGSYVPLTRYLDAQGNEYWLDPGEVAMTERIRARVEGKRADISD